jgi:lysophospholipase L1-like esterase
MDIERPILFGRLVCASALAAMLAACSANNGSTKPTPTPDPNGPVIYSAIGASDAAGWGSSVPCLPFIEGCTNGTSYVAIIARELAAGGKSVTLTNLGIPTAVIGPTFQTLGATYGREIVGNFLQQEMPFVARDSTVVTIFAGGNDTNTISAAVGGGAGGSDPLGFVDNQVRVFDTDYEALVKGIKDRAPNARIVILNLPNFAGMPMTAGYSLDRKQLVQKISVGFSTQGINDFATRGIAVVDMLCDPRSYDPGIYSSDGFHPNDAGYAYMASEVIKALTSSYPAPRTSCSYMAIVPPL